MDRTWLQLSALLISADLYGCAAYARELLNSPLIQLGSVRIYPSDRERVRSQGEGGTECSYESWRNALVRKELTAIDDGCPEVVEVIRLGKSTLLRRLDRYCRTTRRLLAGDRDPMSIDVGNESYAVLDVIVPEGEYKSPVDFYHVPVKVYVKALERPTREGAIAILEYLRPLTGGLDITVMVRGDSWFATDCAAPARFFWDPTPFTVPSKEEYDGARQITCVALRGWPVQCY